jgi:hypothetical protein
VFLPLDKPVTPSLRSELMRVTRSSEATRQPVKVAVIAAPTDLGAVPMLFDRPARYARFLGFELQFVYPGRLLVVMPAGLAVSQHGRLLTVPVLETIRPGEGSDGLVRAAIAAVEKLAPVASPARPRATREAFRPPAAATPSPVARRPTPISVGSATAIAIGIVSALVVFGFVLIRLLTRPEPEHAAQLTGGRPGAGRALGTHRPTRDT